MQLRNSARLRTLRWLGLLSWIKRGHGGLHLAGATGPAASFAPERAWPLLLYSTLVPV